VFGGLGVAGHRFSADGIESDTESDVAYQLGAGVDFPIGGTTSLYAEGRCSGSGNDVDTQFFEASLGLAFTLGARTRARRLAPRIGDSQSQSFAGRGCDFERTASVASIPAIRFALISLNSVLWYSFIMASFDGNVKLTK